MILEEATYEAFGYYPRDLTRKSDKLVISCCKMCGGYNITTKGHYRSFCRGCSQKLGGKHKGNKSFFLGKFGKNAQQFSGGKMKRVCKKCGKTFYVKQNVVRAGNGFFCSKSCAGFFRKNGYINGSSYLPYCSKFNIAFKRRIRARFGNKCFLCGKTREENGGALSVHHVNYNKNAGCDNTDLLCVPLCHDCHTKTNTNRALWQKTIIQKLRGKGEEKEK
jgi:hypothetical protein